MPAYGTVTNSFSAFGAPCTFSTTEPSIIAVNNFVSGQPVQFVAGLGGTLPTGITANTTYYVLPTSLTSASFEVSLTVGGAAVTPSTVGVVGVGPNLVVLPVKYQSQVPAQRVFNPGQPCTLFGSLTPQAPDWNGACGAPVMPIVPELVTVGEASVSVAIHRDRLFANSFSVALAFSAAPGTFEIDVQTADYDQAGNYVKEIAITNANLSIGGLTARVELPQNVVSRFVRLYVVTFPNFATVTVQGTLE